VFVEHTGRRMSIPLIDLFPLPFFWLLSLKYVFPSLLPCFFSPPPSPNRHETPPFDLFSTDSLISDQFCLFLGRLYPLSSCTTLNLVDRFCLYLTVSLSFGHLAPRMAIIDPIPLCIFVPVFPVQFSYAPTSPTRGGRLRPLVPFHGQLAYSQRMLPPPIATSPFSSAMEGLIPGNSAGLPPLCPLGWDADTICGGPGKCSVSPL